MEGPEWDAQAHGTMHLGSGAEETAISGEGGGEVGRRQGFLCIWAPLRDGDLLQIPRVGDLGDGRRLSFGGEELGPGKGGVEEDVAYHHQGGSDASGVRLILKAVIQTVLLFRAETWVVTPRMGKDPVGFQTQV